MVKVTLKDGTIVEGTPEEIYALDLFVGTDEVESVEVEEEPLKAGDYAVVIGNTTHHNFNNGTLVRVERRQSENGVIAEYIDGSDWWVVYDVDLRKATEAEVAQAEVDAIERKRDAIFTANGRKVNELRKGDLVRVIDNCGAYAFGNGSIVEVSRDSITLSANVGNGWLIVADIVAFVENRLDIN